MKKYFVWHQEENEFETFATIEEMEKEVKEIIDFYAGEGEWPKECDMNGIVSGVITHQVQQTDYEARPDEISDDGTDKNGNFWRKDWESKCNYENLPLKEE